MGRAAAGHVVLPTVEGGRVRVAVRRPSSREDR